MNKHLYSNRWKDLTKNDVDFQTLDAYPISVNTYVAQDDFGLWYPDEEEEKEKPVLPENNKLQPPKCKHLKKRKSHALGNSFWYCPDCKEEVDGD